MQFGKKADEIVIESGIGGDIEESDDDEEDSSFEDS